MNKILDWPTCSIPNEKVKNIDSFQPRPYLTHRQKQCMRLLIEGQTAGEISLSLRISIRMVREHLHHAKIQLDCYSTLQAAVKADRLGLLK